MAEFTIRKLQPTDIPLAKELIKAWQDDGFAIKTAIPNEEYLYTLMSGGSFHVIVAIVNDKVVGGLTGYELTMFDKEVKELFLYDIAVIAAHRNKNIAKELIAGLKTICTGRGITTMYVATTPDNEAAKQLYQTTGGEIETISWFTYDLGNE